MRVPDRAAAEFAVGVLLRWTGDNPNREGLQDTPRRVTDAWAEMTAGYQDDPAEILDRTFDSDHYDELIVVRHVDFVSLCEHHVLPFTGHAHVGYLPGPAGRIVGLSKLARLVDCFARRLQVQERMTREIAEAVNKHLDPAGVGVVVQATHSCMGCRGVKKPHADMVTSAMLGAFREEPTTKAEFLAMIATT